MTGWKIWKNSRGEKDNDSGVMGAVGLPSFWGTCHGTRGSLSKTRKAGGSSHLNVSRVSRPAGGACLLAVFQDRVPYAGQLCIAAVLASCALVVCVGEQGSEGLEVFVGGVGGEVVE